MFCKAKNADSALEKKADKANEINIRMMYQYGTSNRGPLKLLTNHLFNIHVFGDQTILQLNSLYRLISLFALREFQTLSIEPKATPGEKPRRRSLPYSFRLNCLISLVPIVRNIRSAN